MKKSTFFYPIFVISLLFSVDLFSMEECYTGPSENIIISAYGVKRLVITKDFQNISEEDCFSGRLKAYRKNEKTPKITKEQHKQRVKKILAEIQNDLHAKFIEDSQERLSFKKFPSFEEISERLKSDMRGYNEKLAKEFHLKCESINDNAIDQTVKNLKFSFGKNCLFADHGNARENTKIMSQLSNEQLFEHIYRKNASEISMIYEILFKNPEFNNFERLSDKIIDEFPKANREHIEQIFDKINQHNNK